jgi:hypothetical protein
MNSWAWPRSSRYCGSAGGRAIGALLGDLAAGVDVRGSCKEPLAVADRDLVVVVDLPVLISSRDHLEEVSVRADRRRWDTPDLRSGHRLLDDDVVRRINLDMEFV